MKVEDGGCIPVAEVFDAEISKLWSFSEFNPVQSGVLEQALGSDDPLVVAAPTGCGKMVIFELAIIRALKSASRGSHAKIVYIAPTKALCQEKFRDWSKRFAVLGLRCAEITGDVPLGTTLRNIAQANLLLTTPEKWDSVTRMWREHVFLLGSVSLLLIDEVHMLHEPRGATLEIIVCRMKTLTKAYASSAKHTVSPFRVVALSATLPNIGDVGQWLECKPGGVHLFDDSFRPVPLSVTVLGYNAMKNEFLFEKSLDQHVPGILRHYSNGRPSLVFCGTKKSAETLAALLAKTFVCPNNPQAAAALTQAAAHIQDPNLKAQLPSRIAYHHAGLPADDRTLVETLFANGALQVLCATTTLAVGVNLPAHLVVIKGTTAWRGSQRGYENIQSSSLLQMIGRAGRPGFDESGVAVVMTSKEHQHLYEDMLQGKENVESNLQSVLVEAIAAEITQGVITDVSQAIEWLKSTFFYVRVQRNPRHYALPSGMTLAQLAGYLRETSLRTILKLAEAKIVTMEDDQFGVTPNPEAHIMTKHLIKFETMVKLMALPATAPVGDVLQTLSSCSELDKPVRRPEKRCLNEVMKNVRFTEKNARVQTGSEKASALIQAVVHRLPLQDFHLKMEQAEIVDQAQRILQALHDLAIKDGKGHLLWSTVALARALEARVWETDEPQHSLLMQLPHVDVAVAKRLQEHDIRTLQHIASLNIAELASRSGLPRLAAGETLAFARALWASSLDVELSERDRRLIFHIKHAASLHHMVPDGSPALQYQLIVHDMSSGALVCHRRINGARDVDVPSGDWRELAVHLCAQIAGYDIHKTLAKDESGHWIPVDEAARLKSAAPPIEVNERVTTSVMVEKPRKVRQQPVVSEAAEPVTPQLSKRPKQQQQQQQPRQSMQDCESDTDSHSSPAVGFGADSFDLFAYRSIRQTRLPNAMEQPQRQAQAGAPAGFEPEEEAKPTHQPMLAAFPSSSPGAHTPLSASKRLADPPAMSASRPIPAPLALLRSKAQELDLDLRFPYVRRIRKPSAKQPKLEPATPSSCTTTSTAAAAAAAAPFFALHQEGTLSEFESSAPADNVEPTAEFESASEEFAFDPATHLTFGDCF